MTHLRIEQNNGVIEEVSTSVITKLYEIAHAGLDVSSNLQGRLHCPVSYRNECEYLTTQYPNLYISVDNYAIPFEDPNMITHLNSVGIGSNGTVTEADARNATTIPYVDNDVVTKFNELRYFTNINKTAAPRRGEDETGSASFNGWAALEEIDISNYVSVGRYEAYSSEWCLRGMPALTTVIASNKLKNIGYGAFAGDNNLETISGLSGLITLRGEDCFLDCWKLLSSNFTNVQFAFADNAKGCFRYCKALTSITLDSSVTTIPDKCFQMCNQLTTLNGASNVTSVGQYAFNGCSALTSITGTSGITFIGKSAFEGCTNLASTFDFANTTTIQDSAFRNCKNCTFTNLDKVSNFGMTAFGGTNIPTSVQFKDGVSIGMQSFENSNVQSIEFLGGGTIGRKGIQKAKSLQSIVFNADISLGAGCFQECTHLQSVDLSNISEQSLFYNAGYGFGGQFASCSALSSATLNPNITKLPQSMFAYFGNSNLELTIPAGVTEIGENFLYGTNGVKLTVLATTPPTLANQNALGGVTYIKVPAGTLSAYQSAQYWSSKASAISELPS